MDNRYKGRTLDWLILSNAARTTPFPDRDLCAYNNHNYGSIRVRKTYLRREGALNKDGTVNWTHPHVQNLKPPIEELQPLALQPSALGTTIKQKVLQNISKKLDAGHTHVAATFDAMSKDRAIEILSNWVNDGSAGRDTPKFLAQILAIQDSISGGVGPPPPSSPRESISRLITLFDSINDASIVETALREYHDLLTARKAAASPPPPSDGPPNALEEPSGPSGPSPPDGLPEPPPRGIAGDTPPRVAPLGTPTGTEPLRPDLGGAPSPDPSGQISPPDQPLEVPLPVVDQEA